MSGSPGTPNGRHAARDFEFTPIGYVREKENSLPTTLESESRKRSSPNNSIEKGDDEPPRKSARPDDTLNSTHIFNESSFDDTVPSQSGIPSLRRNRASEIGGSDAAEENGGTSNPLKEQQETLYKLNVENYNLRVKCNSLLKFLNNVTDEGELKDNLAVIEELQEWKTKYQELRNSYRELQLKFDQTESKEKSDKDERANNEQFQLLEHKLAEYQDRVAKSKLLIDSLGDRLSKSEDKSKSYEEQGGLEAKSLRQKNQQLESAMATKDSEIHDYKQQIENLTQKLHMANREETDSLGYKHQVDQQTKQIEALQADLRNTVQERNSTKDLLTKTKESLHALQEEVSHQRSEARREHDRQVDTLKAEVDNESSRRRELQQQVRSLEKDLSKANSHVKDRDERILTLEKQLDDLKQRSNQLRNLDGKIDDDRKIKDQKIKELRAQIQQVVKQKDELNRKNEELRERIVTQATRSPALKINTRKTLENDIETQKLRAKNQELEVELNSSIKALDSLRQNYRGEIEELKSQLERSETDQLLTRRALEKEISKLKFELEALHESKRDEIAILENRCSLLRQENDHLSSQGGTNLAHLQKAMAEKQKQIDELVQRCSDHTMEKLRLNKELAQTQEAEAESKKELSKLSARLEYITKEFVKFRETGNSDENTSASKLNEKWSEKYQRMKQKLLDELKLLQNENLALERASLENGKRPRLNTPNIESLSLQDQLDYYRLRYHHEVIHNNDLKVMNEYLNRVLRASAQHVRLDILKLA